VDANTNCHRHSHRHSVHDNIKVDNEIDISKVITVVNNGV